MNTYLDSLFNLKGKTALVTGGAKGLGHMISHSLVQAGCRVYIASRSVDDCQRVANELSESGECIAMPADLSTLEGINELVENVKQASHGLDILFNNSGRSWGAELGSYPEKGWDSVMDLNVKTPFFLTQQLLPLLKASGTLDDPSKVINIGSVAGITAESLNAYAYGPSKAAIHQLTKMLAKDLAPHHVTVNAIAPGFFPSKMTRHITSDEDVLAETLSYIPLGRLGKADEIGALSVYLSSKASAFMTGTILPLDGGTILG